jgi:C_GCAxxG_C_C family probable redox protein
MLVSNQQTERALELFSRKYNCAQSVFAACAASKILNEQERLALAAPFGGGIAQQGETCGALTGALLALGEADGKAMVADPSAGRSALYKQAQQLTKDFRSAHGSILCHELTGCFLNTEEGQRVYKERGLHQTLCRDIVTSAVSLVDKILVNISPQK